MTPQSFVPPVSVEDFLHCCELMAQRVTDGAGLERSVFFVDEPVALRMVAVRERCGQRPDEFLAITARFLAVMELHRELLAAGHLREIQGGVEIDAAVFAVAATHPIEVAADPPLNPVPFLAEVAKAKARGAS